VRAARALPDFSSLSRNGTAHGFPDAPCCVNCIEYSSV
jgi:hypothetical protein